MAKKSNNHDAIAGKLRPSPGALKGVSDEMNWGSKVYSNDRHWYGTVALDTLMVHNKAAIL